MIVTGINSSRYKAWRNRQNATKNNGAYYYAKEIEDIILPELTHLNIYINTVGAMLYKPYEIPHGAVIVAHDNINTTRIYRHLFGLNVLWICSKQSTARILVGQGENTVYIPLSVDTEYVKKFARKQKTKDTAFIGNAWGFKRDYLNSLPGNIDQIYGLEREALLKEMAKYNNIIAEDRCLIEAKVLGANILHPRYDRPDYDVIDREILDTRDALPIWREVLEKYAADDPTRFLQVRRIFRDTQIKRNRRLGEVFAASEERARVLLSNELNLVRELPAYLK